VLATCHGITHHPFVISAGLSKLAENEAKRLVEAALAVAKDIVAANRQTHDGLSAELEEKERLEGQALRRWLSQVNPHSISIYESPEQPFHTHRTDAWQAAPNDCTASCCSI
jgi:hypothetical protein